MLVGQARSTPVLLWIHGRYDLDCSVVGKNLDPDQAAHRYITARGAYKECDFSEIDSVFLPYFAVIVSSSDPHSIWIPTHLRTLHSLHPSNLSQKCTSPTLPLTLLWSSWDSVPWHVLLQ